MQYDLHRHTSVLVLVCKAVMSSMLHALGNLHKDNKVQLAVEPPCDWMFIQYNFTVKPHDHSCQNAWQQLAHVIPCRYTYM